MAAGALVLLTRVPATQSTVGYLLLQRIGARLKTKRTALRLQPRREHAAAR